MESRFRCNRQSKLDSKRRRLFLGSRFRCNTTGKNRTGTGTNSSRSPHRDGDRSGALLGPCHLPFPPQARRAGAEGGTAGGRPLRGTACSTELTTIATRAVRCALVVKQAVQGELAVASVGPLCALCQGSRATHYMLPCMCMAVCEPCGKLKLFRYDDPTMPSSVIVPRCPTCSAPAES